MCGLSLPRARGILVSQSGMEPVSPELQSRFSTTKPPMKSLIYDVMECLLLIVTINASSTLFKLGKSLDFPVYVHCAIILKLLGVLGESLFVS